MTGLHFPKDAVAVTWLAVQRFGSFRTISRTMEKCRDGLPVLQTCSLVDLDILLLIC